MRERDGGSRYVSHRKRGRGQKKQGKRPSLSSLRRKLDQVFSAWIRNRDTTRDGWGHCISCNAWSRLQAGHWIKRQYLATRFDQRNVNGQCVRCNHFLHGNDGPYTLAMLKKYGHGVVDELMQRKHRTVKLTRDDYLVLLHNFRLP